MLNKTERESNSEQIKLIHNTIGYAQLVPLMMT